MFVKRVVAVVLLFLGITLAAAPSASASGSFYAGTLYSDANWSGQSVAVFMPNYGVCDRAGYTLRLATGVPGAWDGKLSSFTLSFNNGCDAARVLTGGLDGYWIYYISHNAKINVDWRWNDNAARINYYCSRC